MALVTTRYTAPGVYIAQLIRPRPGNLAADARVCNYVGRGSRLAKASNLGIRRSFVFEETLSFPPNAPFEAFLDYPSNGDNTAPARVFDSVTGIELRSDQWSFVKIAGEYTKVLIAPSAFDPAAAYKIDYQSVSREVKDPIPVDNIRAIKTVGTIQDKAEFEDLKDFFIPFSYAGPSDDSDNMTTSSFITSVIQDVGNTGGGTAAIEGSASYDHDYNRFYQLEVTAIAGGPGTYQATFEWSARRYSGGAESLPPVPLHTTGVKPTFVAQEAVPASLVQDLELGVKVELTFSGTNFAVGDKFYFNGVGPGKLEFDSALLNTNQFLEFSSILKTPQLGSTGLLSYSGDNNYTGDYNLKFQLLVTNSGGIIGSRTVDFIWASYGDIIGPTSLASVAEATPTLTLTSGVKLSIDFGASNFVAGDVFDFEVKVPKKNYQAKDDRVFEMTVSAATNPGADEGFLSGSYATGTVEGGFGTWEANMNLLSGPSQEHGYIELPDGVSYFARNMIRGNINGTSYGAGDVFSASVTSDDVIDWSLTTRVEETREVASFVTDVTGAVTGVAGTKYIILDNVYESGTVVVTEELSGNPVSFIEIPDSQFVGFITAPSVAVKIEYEFRGSEPTPGQLYYFTANYLRPQELYDNPTLILSKDDGRLFLAPSETNNHLYIMNELAFDLGAPATYYTQVYDSDGDGVLTTTDVNRSLDAHEKVSRPTDLCLLSLFGSLGRAMTVNEKANDPFEKREQMLWVGTPIGTPIGDLDTPNSLVYLAKRTLQVTPQSYAQGTRVLVAPTQCRANVLLDSGVTQEVTLDGSFVAGAASAITNSFADPAQTILRKNLTGFTYVQTYTDPQNLIIGNASITWLSSQSNSIYRFEEDITVHTMAEEFQLISATTQKQYVTRVVRSNMDQALISIVPPSAQAAMAFIKSTLSGFLIQLVGSGITAPYQNEETGEERQFDPDADVVVLRDTDSLTKYNFYYCYFIRVPIKRLFGLYAVNSNDFGLGQ